MSNLFEEGETIAKYTRKQAIEDGVLVDISNLAKEAGIKFPTAVTRGVFAVLSDTSALGQDFTGRARDMLMVFQVCAMAAKSDEILFAPIFVTGEDHRSCPVPMWAVCGPGDDGDAVITIMLEGQD